QLHIDGSPGSARPRASLLQHPAPATSFLAHPRRYGARFAYVVPALTRAPSWSLDARIRREGHLLGYHLDATAPLGKGRRARYDSRWEADLARDLREALAADAAGPAGAQVAGS